MLDKYRLFILRTSWWLLASVGVVSGGIACLSNPCSHGICIDDVNSTYSCYCVDGYTGVQCQTNWDECWSDPCQNGGTCVDGIASYNCSCPDGFIGDNCETNYNECESNPCLNNGTCIDMTNGYMCSCVPGFAGEHCEVDVAVCNSSEEVRCHNGGQCIEGPGFKFYCRCAPGWTGQKCEDQIDECESNPCRNGGICIDVHADYLCACTYGFTGKSCEVQIEFCDDNSCSNNALCVVEDGIRVCYCVPDFHGERCELQYDECLLEPRCMNGGTCIDGVDNFTCSCPPNLTGSLCECLIQEDGIYDCNYIAPTLPPDSNLLTFVTSLTEIYTTDLQETTYIIGHNGTSFGIDDFTTPIIRYDTTTKDYGQATTDNSNITIEIQTKEPLIPDSSKTDTTTECKGSCSNITEPTSHSSLEPEQGTTEIDKPDIGITQLTTELVIVQHVDTTTMKYTSPESRTEEPPVPPLTTQMELTTEKQDMTTHKLFTDTPTEHAVTDIPTSISLATIEPTDFTIVSENGTLAFTTEISECTNSVCNDRGYCVSTANGFQCKCNFNYKGKYCEDKVVITSAAFGGKSYVSHKLRNSSSINIDFNAKTLISDGQLMDVDIAKDVYMQLYMESGLLKFKFSCGYQTMLLSELKTYVNKGYPMKIETSLDLYFKEQHCNATLRLNDTVAMSGGQIANITSLYDNATLNLGNSINTKDSEYKPFIGCIGNLVVNGEKREIFGDAIEAGDVAECSSLSCLSGPCLNGGTCTDNGESYTCLCANGWMGAHCNKSVCENNPCQSGGSCVKHPGSGFLCLCPYGRHGIFCEYNVEITRPSLAPINSGMSAYLMYPLSQAALNSDRFDLRLRFQTADMDQIALLAFVGQSGHHDSKSQHLALTFVKGYIMLTWNMGAGPRRIFTARALSQRRGGHTVRVWRRGRTGGLSVDGRHNISGNAPLHDSKMAVVPYVFVGGHPSESFQDLPHDLPLHTGWRGCIWEVSGQAVGSGKAIGGRGVGQCGVAQCTAKSCNAPRGVCIHSPATYGCICNEGSFGPTCSATRNPCDRSLTKCLGKCVITTDNAQCDCPYGKTGIYCEKDMIPTDVLFTGIRSYVRLHPRTISSVSLSLEAEIKPTKVRGLLVFAKTPHFYTALSLQGGLLEYRWTDHLSGVTSLVRSGVVLSMSQWHNVKAGRYGSRLYVWVDGSLSTEALLAHAFPHTASNATILLGGAEDLAELPFDAMSGPPESYMGCIRNLHINNVLLPLEPQNIISGQNLGDCDGTVCGLERCGGGSCEVEGDEARCRCGEGARCRRHVCSAATCAPPAGLCRGGRCVCAAGRAGDYCDTKINITTPQFGGDSLISLGRRATFARQGEQRISTGLTRPKLLTLNFTTAEPNGLLLWMTLDDDYLGIGLEKGFLRLIWSVHQNSTIEVTDDRNIHMPKTFRSTSKLAPNVGWLADAEWHVVNVALGKSNISVKVDGVIAYVEEPGISDSDYENVDLFFGGITQSESALAKSLFPDNFKGCIDNISTDGQHYVTNYTDVYSENVKSCQLIPAR